MSNEHLNDVDLTICIPKYLISVTEGKSFPVELTTPILAQLISQRGPIRIQQDFLKLIAISIANEVLAHKHVASVQDR